MFDQVEAADADDRTPFKEPSGCHRRVVGHGCRHVVRDPGVAPPEDQLGCVLTRVAREHERDPRAAIGARVRLRVEPAIERMLALP